MTRYQDPICGEIHRLEDLPKGPQAVAGKTPCGSEQS